MSETRCSWATIHYYKLYCRISHLRLFAEKLLLVSNIKKKNNNDAVDFTSVCKEFQEGGREGQRERERERERERDLYNCVCSIKKSLSSDVIT